MSALISVVGIAATGYLVYKVMNTMFGAPEQEVTGNMILHSDFYTKDSQFMKDQYHNINPNEPQTVYTIYPDQEYQWDFKTYRIPISVQQLTDLKRQYKTVVVKPGAV